jgi:hypothetical protein
MYRITRRYRRKGGLRPSSGLFGVPEELVLPPDKTTNASFIENKRCISGKLEDPTFRICGKEASLLMIIHTVLQAFSLLLSCRAQPQLACQY